MPINHWLSLGETEVEITDKERELEAPREYACLFHVVSWHSWACFSGSGFNGRELVITHNMRRNTYTKKSIQLLYLTESTRRCYFELVQKQIPTRTKFLCLLNEGNRRYHACWWWLQYIIEIFVSVVDLHLYYEHPVLLLTDNNQSNQMGPKFIDCDINMKEFFRREGSILQSYARSTIKHY